MEFWDGSGISWTICKQSAPRSRQITTPTHTHPFNGHFSGTTQVNRYQKGKTNLDFTEARDSEWQWHQLEHMQVCTSLQTDNHASIPPLSFLQDGCPSWRPTNSVKALKAPTPHHSIFTGSSWRPINSVRSTKGNTAVYWNMVNTGIEGQRQQCGTTSTVSCRRWMEDSSAVVIAVCPPGPDSNTSQSQFFPQETAMNMHDVCFNEWVSQICNIITI